MFTQKDQKTSGISQADLIDTMIQSVADEYQSYCNIHIDEYDGTTSITPKDELFGSYQCNYNGDTHYFSYHFKVWMNEMSQRYTIPFKDIKDIHKKLCDWWSNVVPDIQSFVEDYADCDWYTRREWLIDELKGEIYDSMSHNDEDFIESLKSSINPNQPEEKVA